MEAGLIERIETGAERGASALFAGAVAYAAYGLLVTIGFEVPVALAAAGAGAMAYWPCSRAFGAGRRSPTFDLPAFMPRETEFSEPAGELLLTERSLAADELLLTDRAPGGDELVLTDADRLDSDAPLVLDDILAAIGPDSRVVRMFDRKTMPASALTPGQLHSRVAGHLRDGASRPAPPDASEALSAALAELRRSLR
jgi:hypothetical protein